MSGAAGKLMKLAFQKIINEEAVVFNRVMNKCEFLSGEMGRCVASLKVEKEHCNPFGSLHGGLSAALVDTVSTVALVTDDEASLRKLGVSTDIHTSYLKAAKLGEEIIIDARVLKRGRTLAFLEVEIRNKANDDLLVKGTHTKFVG